jgi:S1-C subfamily serine protease
MIPIMNRITRCSTLLVFAAFALNPLTLFADDSDPSTLEALQQSVQSAAAKIAQSVVLVYVDRDAASDKPLTNMEKRRLGLLSRRPSAGYFKRPSGPTTGVVVAKDGVILTSGFNVSGKIKKIWVVTADGKKRAAKLLGRDPNIDICAIKVTDSSGLVVPQMGDSKNIVPGRFAVLVSRSEGSKDSNITFGIISAVKRERQNAFQIQCRMNYGNVGGAVIDLQGRLLGISARLSNRTIIGQNSGVGFAAPMHKIKKIYSTIVAGKDIPKVKTPFMGIQGSRDAPKKGQKGVKIIKVLDGTAAAKAGLKDGDVIKIFNGVEVNDFQTLAEEIRKLSVGDKILVAVARGDWQKDIIIVLGERAEGQ